LPVIGLVTVPFIVEETVPIIGQLNNQSGRLPAITFQQGEMSHGRETEIWPMAADGDGTQGWEDNHRMDKERWICAVGLLECREWRMV